MDDGFPSIVDVVFVKNVFESLVVKKCGILAIDNDNAYTFGVGLLISLVSSCVVQPITLSCLLFWSQSDHTKSHSALFVTLTISLLGPRIMRAFSRQFSFTLSPHFLGIQVIFHNCLKMSQMTEWPSCGQF